MDGLLWLHDARLTRLAFSLAPAWLWSHDAKQVLWSNPTAADIFGAPTPAALSVRVFEIDHIAVAQVTRLATNLRSDGAVRLERLTGFSAEPGRRLTCACSRIQLADGTPAVMLAAIERSGRDLSLAQRVSRLLAACVEPVAVFDGHDGALIGASSVARQHIGNATTLTSLGAAGLIAQANAEAITGQCTAGTISLHRIAEPRVWVLHFKDQTSGAHLAIPVDPETVPAGIRSDTPEPGLSAVERHAFHELSLQLARRINEADALAARAANTNAPPEPGLVQPALSDQRPTPPAVVVDGEDSEIRASLDAARARVNELEAILDIAVDGVVMLDRGARILSANRHAQTLFDYDAHDLEGRSFGDLFAPESIGVVIDALQRLQNKGTTASRHHGREVIGRERLGGLIPLIITISRIEDDGTVCALFRDITPWKKAEEESTAARRDAERTAAAQSDFLAKVSHEIRTPLNAIIGFSEVMAQERFGPIGNERYRAYLRDIHASGEQLLSLINDLIDLSKIETGTLELSVASVSLNEITEQCVAAVQPQARRERVIIRTSLSPRLPAVIADARSVRQIVLNLLSNSIRFTVAGGQVIVSTAVADTGEILLRVRDTGIGMSEADIASALEPFRQGATASRARSGGTGLGLPLTRALALANRATFHIRSVPNEGTLVEIAFPGARLMAAQ